MKDLLASLTNSIEAIVSLLVLLFIFLAIFALLGIQVFGGKFKHRLPPSSFGEKIETKIEEDPRSNFNSFSESFSAVFQVNCWK